MSEAIWDQQELPLDVRNAIHQCAAGIISMESKCIEWGATPERSVELAAESIANLVTLLQFSGQLTIYTLAKAEGK